MTGECVHLLKGHTDQVYSASFSSDGRYLISASLDRTVRIWDYESGDCVVVFEGNLDEVFTAALSQDGWHVVSSSFDSKIRV